MLVILEVLGYLWSFGVFFNYFGGFKGILVFLVIFGYVLS